MYRFWRDLGYPIGAVIAGLLAQGFSLSAAMIAGSALTLASGLLAARWLAAERASTAVNPIAALPPGRLLARR